MKVAYVAGPYRNEWHYHVVQNIRHAEAQAIRLWQAGYAVICPHMNTALLTQPTIPDEQFLKGELELLKRCDCLCVMPGWEKSSGTKDEIKFALNHDIQIFYLECDIISVMQFAVDEIDMLKNRLLCVAPSRRKAVFDEAGLDGWDDWYGDDLLPGLIIQRARAQDRSSELDVAIKKTIEKMKKFVLPTDEVVCD